MSGVSADERAAMRREFARLLSKRALDADIRRVMATPNGHDGELWGEIAGIGLTALLVQTRYGGIEAGAAEAGELMEEAGAVLLSGALMWSAIVATSLLAQCNDENTCARLLPGLASGNSIATVALGDRADLWSPSSVAVRATPCRDGWRLNGTAGYVAIADIATMLVIVATADDGVACYDVSPGCPGIDITPLKTWDPTLRLSHIVLHDVLCRRINGLGEPEIERTLNLARVALAGEQAGGARRLFERTLDYLKTRIQFGRPVGSFQAIKHIAADLFIDVESATSAARAAALALAASTPDAARLVSLSAFTCAEAFDRVAAWSIQLHGGIAFTWDHYAHLYWRRARADAQLLGPPDDYRERFMAALESAA